MNLLVSYKYLVALDDHRHFGRAALACHVTQPALSNALRALEEGFGTSIVRRGRSFAGFTVEGERVLVSARRILHEQELLQQDLHGSAAAPSGQLSIGAVPTAMPIAARFVAMLQDRYPLVVPTLKSVSSVELETGLESLAIDMGLGYTDRQDDGRRSRLRVLPQYVEHYFLLRRAAVPGAGAMRIGAPMRWADAAALPLCLLGADMHNRTVIDRAFRAAGVAVLPAIETNSTVTLVISVVAGRVCSVLPGAVLGAMQDHRGLEALPLVEPQVAVPIAFLLHGSNRPSRTLQAALAWAQDPDWLAQSEQHAGALTGDAASPRT